MVSAAFLIVRDSSVVAFLTVWAMTVRLTHLDARARLANRSAIRAAVALAALVPVGGFVLYRVLRPAETRLERRERRLARLLAELELAGAEREEDLGHVRQHDRLAPPRDELSQRRLDREALRRRRRGDEADREEAVEDALGSELLAVR